MTQNPPADPLELRVSALEKEVGNVSTLPSMREALAKLDTKTSMVHDEMDMFLKGLSNQSERMGEMREALAGQREQHSAHHKENQNSFNLIRTSLTAVSERLDPIMEAFESPQEMGEVTRGARDSHVYQKAGTTAGGNVKTMSFSGW